MQAMLIVQQILQKMIRSVEKNAEKPQASPLEKQERQERVVKVTNNAEVHVTEMA